MRVRNPAVDAQKPKNVVKASRNITGMYIARQPLIPIFYWTTSASLDGARTRGRIRDAVVVCILGGGSSGTQRHARLPH